MYGRTIVTPSSYAPPSHVLPCDILCGILMQAVLSLHIVGLLISTCATRLQPWRVSRLKVLTQWLHTCNQHLQALYFGTGVPGIPSQAEACKPILATYKMESEFCKNISTIDTFRFSIIARDCCNRRLNVYMARAPCRGTYQTNIQSQHLTWQILSPASYLVLEVALLISRWHHSVTHCQVHIEPLNLWPWLLVCMEAQGLHQVLIQCNAVRGVSRSVRPSA